jgi:hypothetical protein
MVSLGVGRDIILADCPPEKAFWLCNGTTCRNIFELESSIAKTDNYTFAYHVNSDHDKNDFADWIRNVLGDRTLADKLEAIKDKTNYLKIIRARIKELKNM